MLTAEIGTRTWPDRATARTEVFSFIETFYNRRRLRKHPSWGYLTPHETRQRHTIAAYRTSVRDHGETSRSVGARPCEPPAPRVSGDLGHR